MRKYLPILGLLLCAAPAQAFNVPTKCGVAQNGGSTPRTTYAMTCTATAGSAQIITLSGLVGSPNPKTFSISDTQGNTFSLIPGDMVDSSANGVAQIHFSHVGHISWFVPAVLSSGSNTYTFTWTNNMTYVHSYVTEWTGQAADILDGTVSVDNSTGGASPLSTGAASGLAANANDLVYVWCESGMTNAAATGFTNLDTSLGGELTSYKTGGGAGNSVGTCAFTGGSASYFSAEVITLRPAGTYTGIRHRQAVSCGVQNLTACRMYLAKTQAGSAIVIQGMANGSDTLSFSDSAGNSYSGLITLNGTSCFTGGQTAACGLVYLPNAGAGIDWVQLNLSPGDNGAASMVEYTGVSTSPLDQQSTNSSSTTSGAKTSTNITPTVADFVLVGFSVGNATSGNSNITATGSYTAITSAIGIGGQSLIADQIVTGGSGAYNYTLNQGNSSITTEYAVYNLKAATASSAMPSIRVF